MKRTGECFLHIITITTILLLIVFNYNIPKVEALNLNLTDNSSYTSENNNDEDSVEDEDNNEGNEEENNTSKTKSTNNTSSTNETYNSSTNTTSTKVSSISNLPESNLGFSNILNIFLIVIGILLVLLGIAILIRLNR